MKKAVIYARYSSDRQTEQSIEGQRTVCQKYANENDILIVDEYIDRAMTGKNDNRPAFQKMLQESQKADWDFVLVYAVDRFGRNAVEVAINKQRLKKTNKTFISATQITSDNVDGSQNLNGILLENLYIGMAEYYSAELSQKIRRGMKESAMKGQTTGGVAAFGYDIVDKKYVVNEFAAPIVTKIFEDYAAGKTAKQIADSLNTKGLTNRKNEPFSFKNIYNIIRNEIYIGIKKVDGTEYKNKDMQIVTDELFEKVKKELDKNIIARSRKKSNGKYLLTGKLFCGYCNSLMTSDSGTGKHGDLHYYYKCATKKRAKKACEKNTVTRDWLEELVAKKTIEALSADGVIDAISNQAIKLHTKLLTENKELNILKEQQKEVKTALENILKAVESGVTSKTLSTRLNELESKDEQLTYLIQTEKALNLAFLTEEEIKVFLKTFTNGDSKSKLFQEKIIDTFIVKVELFNEKIIIYYNYRNDKKIDDISDAVYENSGSSYSSMVEVRGVEPLS